MFFAATRWLSHPSIHPSIHPCLRLIRCPHHTPLLFRSPPSRNVIGEIGATHVRVPKPPCNVRKQYTNFNGFFTRVLIGIVDVRGSFLWFACGFPGSLRDDSVLKKTDLYRRIQAEQKKKGASTSTAMATNGKGKGKGKSKGKGKGNAKNKKEENESKCTGTGTGKGKGKGKGEGEGEGESAVLALPGACVLGDSAFVERPWLRTPIPWPRTREECYFNHRHGSLRSANARHRFPGGTRTFGRLKWLFGCLNELLFSAERGTLVVEACVILYNFFLAHDGGDCEKGDDDTYGFADRVPTRKHGFGGRAQWERDREADPPSLRKVEVDYLADEGFLERDWGKEGSKRARMF